MAETISLLNMFSHYEPPEELHSLLSQAAVVAADIDAERHIVETCIHSMEYIPMATLDAVARQIRDQYGLREMILKATHPADQLQRVESQELMDLFVGCNSMNRGILAGAQWQWDGNTIHIRLAANGKKTVEEAVPAVCMQLQSRFATPVSVQVEAAMHLEGSDLFAAMEKMRSSAISSAPKAATPAEQKKTPTANPDVIYGKAFKGPSVPMDTLNLDMGYVIVEGRVFAVEHKELKKRNAWVINFDMTDNRGSVRINRFMENAEAKPVLEAIKEGKIFRVQGKLLINNFDNEMVLKPTSIMHGEMPKRKDTAPGEKRVELHLHTAMSNMDALTSTKAAIKQAAAWGHKAIAITDHGCCQSFTDALHVVEDWKGPPKVAGTDDTIKILYGCEGYYVNDVDDRIVVHGQQDMPFDREFVAFDLETTGLSSRTDRIIEIGAVIMREGKEVDRFQTFVDPGRKLDKKIVELTGITDDMLLGAPAIEQVLPEFLKFCGDRVLVAHNSDFDTGFIRAECARQGYEYKLTSVDTLILAQNLMPQLNKHKLNIVADALSLPEFNHHRAADDAVTCGLVLSRFFAMLEEEQDVHTLQGINPAMVALRSQNRIGDRHARHIILFAKKICANICCAACHKGMPTVHRLHMHRLPDWSAFGIITCKPL